MKLIEKSITLLIIGLILQVYLPALAQESRPLFKYVSTTEPIDSAGQVRENSGIVVSRLNPDVLWGHNDGPDLGRFFAYSTKGKFLGSYVFDDQEHRDMEDLSCGPGPKPGVNYLYMGHIGDNAKKAKRYSIGRVEEPAIDLASIPDDPAKAPTVKLSNVEQFYFTYPDGSHDCEAMMVDPITGDVYLASKSGGKGFGPGKAGIYRIKAGELKNGQETQAEHVATVTNYIKFKTPVLFTAGDISTDGTKIILKNAAEIFVWFRDPQTESVADVLKKNPKAPYTFAYGYDGRSKVTNEKFDGFNEKDPSFKGIMGEAIGFTLDGKGFYTLREGKSASIHYFSQDAPESAPVEK